jgi:phage terminase large subunit-like protein
MTLENIKYSKKKSKNKIDGIIAMLMSLSRAIANVNSDAIDLNKYITDDYLKSLGW